MKHLTSPYAGLLALACLASNSQALTLGELELQSYIGQPLRANVPFKLNDGEQLNADCVSLLAAADDLPSLTQASVLISEQSGLHGKLQIRTAQSIGEPTVGFGIKVDCHTTQLTRSFTAFLNVAPNTDAIVRTNQSTLAQNEPVPTRESEIYRPSQATTLAEIAKKYYPVHTPQYPRYLRKLISANPDYAADTEITSGSAIIIPDKLRSTKKTHVNAASNDSGLLRLDGGTTKSASPSTSANYTHELEQKVLTLQDLQQKMRQEIEILNLRLAQLNTTAPVASKAEPVASLAPTAAPAPSSMPLATAAPIKHNGWIPRVIWLALLTIVGLLLAGWLLLRRRSRPVDWRTVNTEQASFAPNKAPTMMSMLHAGRQGIEVDHYVEDDLSRAQRLIAQGDIMQAIDTLYRAIDEAPEDIERWLMLFRLFRQQGMKSEYARLAQNIKPIVQDAADWELIRSIGAKFDPQNPLYFRPNDGVAEIPPQFNALLKTQPASPDDLALKASDFSIEELDLQALPEPIPAAVDEINLHLEFEPQYAKPAKN